MLLTITNTSFLSVFLSFLYMSLCATRSIQRNMSSHREVTSPDTFGSPLRKRTFSSTQSPARERGSSPISKAVVSPPRATFDKEGSANALLPRPPQVDPPPGFEHKKLDTLDIDEVEIKRIKKRKTYIL